MKLATFLLPSGSAAVGLVDTRAETVLDLNAMYRAEHGSDCPSLLAMQHLIEAGEDGLEIVDSLSRTPPADEHTYSLGSIELLAPLPVPAQIRDFMCFEEHLIAGRAAATKRDGIPRSVPPVWYEQPVFYKANRFSVVGPDALVRWPPDSETIDYELELACIIGRQGVNISIDSALDHVFGFTIFNDWSARDLQSKEMTANLGPGRGKDFDTGNAFGPWVVTTDEIGDPQDLEMVARVNGEEWSRGHSGSMYHTFADMVAHTSRSQTLHPGEILASGTVGGGCGLERGEFLAVGDVVELEVSGIGILRNEVTR